MKKALALVIAIVLLVALAAPLAVSAEAAVPPELATAFPVGTWPLPAGAYDPGLDGNNIPDGVTIYGLFDAAYAPLPAPTAVTGYTAAADAASVTAGTFYVLTTSSGFQYVLVGATGGGAAPADPAPAPADPAPAPADPAPAPAAPAPDLTQPSAVTGSFLDSYELTFGRDAEIPNRFFTVTNLYDHYIYTINPTVATAHNYTVFLKAVAGNTIYFSEPTYVQFGETKALFTYNKGIDGTGKYRVDEDLANYPEFELYPALAGKTLLDGVIYFTNSKGEMQGDYGKGTNHKNIVPDATNVSSANFKLLTAAAYEQYQAGDTMWSEDFTIAKIKNPPPFYPLESYWKDPSTVQLPTGPNVKYVSISVDGYLKLASVPYGMEDGETLQDMIAKLHELLYEGEGKDRTGGGSEGFAASSDNQFNMLLISKFAGVTGTPFVLLDGVVMGNLQWSGKNDIGAYNGETDFTTVALIIGSSVQYAMPTLSINYDAAKELVTVQKWTMDMATYLSNPEPMAGIDVVDPKDGTLIGTTGADGTVAAKIDATKSGIIAAKGISSVPLDPTKATAQFEPYRANDYKDLVDYDGRYAPGLADYGVFTGRPGRQIIVIVVIAAIFTIPLAIIVLHAQRSEIRNRGRKFLQSQPLSRG
ncbi:MAG: hypothetical protein LBN02_05000 [Oscillospiraceae bacterium]|nr:hypothetical protein [Oscillospiraceae bacterium]